MHKMSQTVVAASAVSTAQLEAEDSCRPRRGTWKEWDGGPVCPSFGSALRLLQTFPLALSKTDELVLRAYACDKQHAQAGVFLSKKAHHRFLVSKAPSLDAAPLATLLRLLQGRWSKWWRGTPCE